MTKRLRPMNKSKSVQAVGTPRAFLDAVEKRFGEIVVDLAANAQNTVCPVEWMGPGSAVPNALAPDVDWCEWNRGIGDFTMWLNPPFKDIAPWAQKSALAGARGAPICLLVLASLGTDWWERFIHNRAYVFAIRPRLTFVGHKDPYPKDLALCVWNPPPFGHILQPYSLWNWKKDELR